MSVDAARAAISLAGDAIEEWADALVLFGATGDLARKKLFPALYGLAKRRRLGIPVVGVARSDWDDERLRAYARESVTSQIHDVDERPWPSCWNRSRS